MPSQYQYFVTFQNDSFRHLESRVERAPFSNLLTASLQIAIQEITSNNLRFQIGAGINEVNIRNESSMFKYKINEAKFGVDIYAKHSEKLLLTTKYSALVGSEGYFEWSFLIKNCTDLYGLGEFPIKTRPFKKLLLFNENLENNIVPFILARGMCRNFLC